MIAAFRPAALVAATFIPVFVLAILLAARIAGYRMRERRVHQLVGAGMSLSFLLTSALWLPVLLGLAPPFQVDVGAVVSVHGYHFDILLGLDALGGMYLWLDFLLCGVIGAFSAQYLHREPGFHRFYAMLMLFVIGLALIATGAGLDLVFAGWELVGLSSALLIAYFVRRPAPSNHGLRAYAVYRITDVGLLTAIVLLHHALGTTALADLVRLPHDEALLIGGLLVFGAMGKGAIVPFTPWLPRAMEGPTPSSAIFYGALSIHASPFLLLRVHPLLDAHAELGAAVIALGALTAVHASMVGRTQTDVKSALGYASVAQVGVIWMELGLGLHTLAAVHIFGHAVLRTWQLLRAPSVLHDRNHLMASLGATPLATGRHFERLIPRPLRRWSYRLAVERWFLDELAEGAVRLAFAPLRALDRLDRTWARLLGDARPAPDRIVETQEVES